MKNGKRLQLASRTIPWFYLIYLTCVLVALILVFVSCRVVRNLLAEYEGAQPKYVAAEAFEAYFAPIDYDKLLSEARYNAGVATPEAIREYLSSEVGEEELSWSIGSSNDPTELKYIVKAGRKQIGNIYLTVGEEKTAHGFDTYSLSYVELSLDPTAIPGGIITVTAPAACTVTIDGTALTEDLQTDSYLDTDALKYYPDGVSGVEYAVYTLPVMEELPQEVSVTSVTGDFVGQSEVTFDPSTSAYFAGPAYSEELAEEYGQFAIDAITGYAAFMNRVSGYNLSAIRQYFDQSSTLYSALQQSSQDIFIVQAYQYEITDLESGEFYAHSEDTFSCHISFMIHTSYVSGSSRSDAIDMYVFLRRTDSGWRIYEWFNNA